ncbi:MAG: HAMP domain-containing histidine kinase [Ignavibacteriales bacterium]|nr:HAMP domain-containing histidine kinase [Ignavibacteriales bacterium]HOJ17932.1 HAMP domain-containing sensor histidine kinase [Ignavibacteriaceae bacterium]
MNTSNEGILLMLDSNGYISQILFNNLSISNSNNQMSISPKAGSLFSSLFRDEDLQRVLSFLVDIKSKSASFGWELFLKENYCSLPVSFGGAILENRIMVFGSFSTVDFSRFFSGMMVINNEQTEHIRKLEKERLKSLNSKSADSVLMFDELTRLNNDLVNMQRELSKKNHELAELNKLKNQFIGMAAHDLRSPLGNILNFCEFIEEEPENLSSDQKEFISTIDSLATFMLNMVNELLDVTSIEQGEINLSKNDYDLITCINRVVYLNKSLADRKNIKINTPTFPQQLIVNIDKSKIEQVLTNLLTNAIKYSFPESIVDILIHQQADEVAVSIRDHGQGIKSDELRLLFKPFQKTSTQATAGEKSIGLGLFIVKRIVEAHGGKITAESILNSGTTFTFTLPTK